MSLQAVVLSLLDGIVDPSIRSDIATTIYFLRDVFLSGKIKPNELKSELVDIVSTVVDITHPDLLPDEKKKKVDMIVDQLYRAIRMSTLKMRMMGKYRISPVE